MVLAGFLSFADPPLADATQVLASVKQDGVEIKVISGDNDRVAGHVCAQVGIEPGHIITGDEMRSRAVFLVRIRVISRQRLFDEKYVDEWYSTEGSPSPLGVTWIEKEEAFNFALILSTPRMLRSFCAHPTSTSSRAWGMIFSCGVPDIRARNKGNHEVWRVGA